MSLSFFFFLLTMGDLFLFVPLSFWNFFLQKKKKKLFIMISFLFFFYL